MKKVLSVSLVTAIAIAGCASTPPPNAALENARIAVRSAEADPNVAKYAPLDLQSAQQELKQAEAAALHHDDHGISQPAYLSAQSAKLAPFALIPVLDRISRENESLREALRAAGLGTFELWGQVLRMTAPAIVLGAAMVFMEALKELEIAITLQHFGYQSTAIKIHSLARFHSEDAIANWVLISQILMLPALAVVAFWLSRMSRAGRLA